MITDPRQIGLADFSNNHPVVEFMVNWNDKVQNCEYVKIKIADEEAVLRREHLSGLLFMIGTDKEQRDLIPQRIEQVNRFETILGITATKDIRKGEKINVRVSIPTGSQVIGARN